MKGTLKSRGWAIGLGVVLIAGMGLLPETATAIEKKVRTVPSGVIKPSLTPVKSTDLVPGSCPIAQVFFAGSCRRTAFFNRFLSEGAVLVGVGGPQKTTSKDTGAVVLEALAVNVFQLLYILPTKQEGQHQVSATGYIYRGDYPIVFRQTVTTWQESDGFVHMFEEKHGPRMVPPRVGSSGEIGRGGMRFVPLSWRHYIKTVSGHTILHSDGSVETAIASGGEGGYCDAAASGAAKGTKAGCLITGVAGAAVVGIYVGIEIVAIAAVGTTFAAETVTLAGYAAGVTLGGSLGPASIPILDPLCELLGDLADATVRWIFCEDPPTLTSAPQFLPFEPLVQVAPDTSGLCPGNMVLFTGEGLVCSDKNQLITLVIDGKEQEIEEVVVSCVKVHINKKCVYPGQL